MGQKVHPFSFRLASGKFTWKSRWFARSKKAYRSTVLEDYKLRRQLTKKLKPAGLTGIGLNRSINSLTINLYVTRPGVVIGRGGSGIEELTKDVAQMLGINLKDKRAPKIEIKPIEVTQPDLSAYLVAQRIADQLIRRYPHRRAVSQAMERVMNAGAKGIKIVLGGRIGGAEISRVEKYNQGTVPLQTLRSNTDYAEYPALTKSGYVGIKVWITKKEG